MALWADGLWANGLWGDLLWGTGVNLVPSITTTGLRSGTVDSPYSEQLWADGSGPITWTVTVGALPDGLTLTEAGVIGGTPTTEESQTFTVTATNASGADTQEITLTINAAADQPRAAAAWFLQLRKKGKRKGAGRLL